MRAMHNSSMCINILWRKSAAGSESRRTRSASLRATFTNIESQGIEVVVDSISPWVKRFEDEAEFKLFGQNRQGLYTKIDMRGLMRGDMAARMAYYREWSKVGAYSPNRILELEDENTIGPDGDIHVMQNQNVTLEQIETGSGIPVARRGPD
jgi:hypothetical protein